MKAIPAKTIIHWMKIYKLYRSAFPRYERKPFSIILSMHKKGKTDVWYFEKDCKFAGLAITINGENLILIDYFAVAQELRGRGTGSAILRQLQEQYSPKGLLVEIESVYNNSDNSEERNRRKQFYLRNQMVPMHVMVNLFGVDMELLGYNCRIDYDGYHSFYRKNYGEVFAKHIIEMEYPH